MAFLVMIFFPEGTLLDFSARMKSYSRALLSIIFDIFLALRPF